MPTLLRDVNIAFLVDAQEIGNGVGGGNGAQMCAVAGADHVYVHARDEQCTAAEDRFESARQVVVQRLRIERHAVE